MFYAKASLVTICDQFDLIGFRCVHFGFNITADGSMESTTKTTIRCDGDVELFGGTLGILKQVYSVVRSMSSRFYVGLKI